MNYIEIEQIVYGETLDPSIVEALLELELVDTRRSSTNRIAVAEDHCEEFRAMLRLMVELEINAPGVATIIHMRRRMRALQEEVRQLRKFVR